jgi:hypothetical protein
MAALNGHRKAVGVAANEALGGELGPGNAQQVEETTALAERVLRRRRILHGG